MIDFKKATKDLQKKRGYCVLPIRVYLKGTVIGLRTKNSSLQGSSFESKIVTLNWTIEDKGIIYDPNKLSRIICFNPGVTGWESYYLESFINAPIWENNKANSFCICAGTYNVYDRLEIPIKDACKLRDKLIKYCYNN